jgi:hypothetical protein
MVMVDLLRQNSVDGGPGMENRAVDVNHVLSVYQSRDDVDDERRQYDKMIALYQ